MLVMSTLAWLGGLGWQEAMILLALILLVFGRRIPDLARGAGKAIVEFRNGLRS
jgi:TatA/E family protein of Tat protein translocase